MGDSDGAASGPQVTWAQTLAWRLTRHHLDAPGSGGPVAVARRVAGVHAQLRSSAELAMALRDTQATPAAVRAAVATERTLIKTWAMRGTLHLLPADELGLWSAGLRTRTIHTRAPWLRYHGITAEEVAAVLDAIPEALDGRTLTREQLAREIIRITGRPGLLEPLTQGWGALLKPAAARGELCFGPDDGRNVTFVSPRDWIGDWDQEVDSTWALGEILRRYLDAYGPSTREEFARWMALDPKPARQAVAAAGDTITEVDLEGRACLMTTAGAEQLTATDPRATADLVRLLPGFDPYVIGALRHLEALLPDPSLKKLISRQSGWISPVLLVGGRIAGTWTDERRRGRLHLQLTPFTEVSPQARAAAEEAAEQLAAIQELPAEVTWAPTG